MPFYLSNSIKIRSMSIQDKKRTIITEKGRLGANVAVPLLILSFISQPTPTLVSLLYKYMKKLKIKALPTDKDYNKKGDVVL